MGFLTGKTVIVTGGGRVSLKTARPVPLDTELQPPMQKKGRIGYETIK